MDCVEGGGVMNMDASDAGDEIARYLAQVAWDNPGQLPWAMVGVVQYGVMVALVNFLCEGIGNTLQDFEELFKTW